MFGFGRPRSPRPPLWLHRHARRVTTPGYTPEALWTITVHHGYHSPPRRSGHRGVRRAPEPRPGLLRTTRSIERERVHGDLASGEGGGELSCLLGGRASVKV